MNKFKINQWMYDCLSLKAKLTLDESGFKPVEEEITLWSVPKLITARNYPLDKLNVGEAFNIFKLENVRKMQDACCVFNNKTGRVLHLNTKIGIVVRLA